jgi:hypothetical protein
LKKPNKSGNLALYEHIVKLMRGGLKMDQLILENSDAGGWCHVSPCKYENGTTEIRGETFKYTDPNNTTHNLVEQIPQAIGNSISIDMTADMEIFLNYWKKAENNKNDKNGGWDETTKLWTKHASPEANNPNASECDKKPTIAYGIKLCNGYLESKLMKSYKLSELQDGTQKITDETAIEEIRTRANNAVRDLKKFIDDQNNKGDWDKIIGRYKYALVDIYLNGGSGNFKSNYKNENHKLRTFTDAAIKNNLTVMLNNIPPRPNELRREQFEEYLKIGTA